MDSDYYTETDEDDNDSEALFKVPLYTSAQFAGAFVGGGFLSGIAPSIDGRSSYNSGLAIPDGLTIAQAFAWET